MRRDRRKTEQESRSRRIGLLTSDQAPADKRCKAVAYLVSRRAAFAWLNRRAEDYAAQRRATA